VVHYFVLKKYFLDVYMLNIIKMIENSFYYKNVLLVQCIDYITKQKAYVFGVVTEFF